MTTMDQEAWVWDAAQGVYYHAPSHTYAIPDPNTGQWSYMPAGSFASSSAQAHDAAARSSQTRNGSKEEGEIEDDVGWGGLMEPAQVAKAVDAQVKAVPKKNPVYASRTRPAQDAAAPSASASRHPAYSAKADYSDPNLYAFSRDSPRRLEAEEEKKETPAHILRLVVQKSECLEVGQVAVIDAREGGVQLGRDRVERGGTARVRLREMAASKTHALIYWGKAGNEADEGEEEEGWWVVDMGSTHGTYVAPSGEQSEASKVPFERLSDPKTASKPAKLSHMCRLKAGSTTFSCHIHPQWPCDACQLRGDNEIRLDDGQAPSPPPSSKTEETSAVLGPGGVPWAMTSAQRRENREVKRKREMASLREALLQKSTGGGGPKTGSKEHNEPSREYIDRSAIRRKMHPTASPPRDTATPPDRNNSNTPPIVVNAKPEGPSKFSQAMMAAQGWTPGSGLGKDATGRSAPIEVELRNEKRGLGAKGATQPPPNEQNGGSNGDWRSQARQRRYEDLRNSGQI